jgi:hypothetical protein
VVPEAYPDRNNLDTRQSSTVAVNALILNLDTRQSSTVAVDALILPHLAEDGREAEYSSLV